MMPSLLPTINGPQLTADWSILKSYPMPTLLSTYQLNTAYSWASYLPKVVTYNRLLIRNPQPTTVWTILWNYRMPRVFFPTQPFLVYYNLTYISVVPCAHSSTFLKTQPKWRPTLLDLLIVSSSIRFQNFTHLAHSKYLTIAFSV